MWWKLQASCQTGVRWTIIGGKQAISEKEFRTFISDRVWWNVQSRPIKPGGPGIFVAWGVGYLAACYDSSQIR